MASNKKVAIIGGGLAGLTAAHYLKKAGMNFRLFEKNETLGGRVASDRVDGFTLDHGFQVFLDNYDEAKAVLDFEKLQLGKAASGAVIRNNNKWDKIGNPLKNWGDLFPTLSSNITTVKDKILILKLFLMVRNMSHDEIQAKENVSTLSFLEGYGFSLKMIQDFFKPFFGGVFLDFELKTSSRLFLYLFQKFSSGNATLPHGGMKTIVAQLASGIEGDYVFMNTEITRISKKTVTTAENTQENFDQIIIATESSSDIQKSNSTWNGTRCYYFSCDEFVLPNSNYLHLVPQGVFIKHVCFLNRINRSYSPIGKELLSVTTLIKNNTTENEVKKELLSLFGSQLQNLTFLKKFDIPKALNFYNGETKGVHINKEGHVICGDHTMYPSINAAMKSGRLAAEIAIASLS